MAERAPVFELHIQPLFRLIDQQHMLRVGPGLNLLDYDAVKAAAETILEKVGGPAPAMPTPDTGGAWPSEWVALFQRWVDTGFRRLSLGTGKNYKLIKPAAGRPTLSCKVDIPDTPEGDSAAWLDIVSLGPPKITYRLVVYPGDAVPPPAASIEVECRERMEPAAADAGVIVIDAAGTHSVNL